LQSLSVIIFPLRGGNIEKIWQTACRAEILYNFWHDFCSYAFDMSIPEINSPSSQRFPDAASGSADAKKWKAAQDFEAIFIHQMLKSMRNTVPKDEEMSSGRRIFTEMLDEQIANTASRTGSFGLANIIYKELAGENAESPQKIMAAERAYGASYSRASTKQIGKWVDEASAAYGVDKSLINAVIRQESGGNSLARSNKGAKGLMQLMDSTAKDMGVANSYNGKQNVMGGVKYLKAMLSRFGGDESKALAAYNAGPGTVEQYGGIPPFEETQNYVKSVLRYREQFSEKEDL
jgi:soluble lytic murein transglycosylase-like protein